LGPSNIKRKKDAIGQTEETRKGDFFTQRSEGPTTGERKSASRDGEYERKRVYEAEMGHASWLQKRGRCRGEGLFWKSARIERGRGPTPIGIRPAQKE